ncbi:MAG: glycosyltransferase, partial [Bacteroidales bacterium]
KYIIGVGRFLEEKGFDYLIRAFGNTNLTEFKLVLVGDSDYSSAYATRLKTFAKENNVILTGFIKGEKLKQIYTFARLFVLSSFSEGLPIALLEALSYGLDVLASDIPANQQIGLDTADYFITGNEADLKEKISVKLLGRRESDYSNILDSKYNWDTIAIETYSIYNKLLNKNET